MILPAEVEGGYGYQEHARTPVDDGAAFVCPNLDKDLDEPLDVGQAFAGALEVVDASFAVDGGGEPRAVLIHFAHHILSITLAREEASARGVGSAARKEPVDGDAQLLCTIREEIDEGGTHFSLCQTSLCEREIVV